MSNRNNLYLVQDSMGSHWVIVAPNVPEAIGLLPEVVKVTGFYHSPTCIGLAQKGQTPCVLIGHQEYPLRPIDREQTPMGHPRRAAYKSAVAHFYNHESKHPETAQ